MGLCHCICVFPKKILKHLLVCVSGVSAAERDELNKKSVNEGDSITLDPGEIKNKKNDVMMWYFNDTSIAVKTGDQSKICTDNQCKERFRDR